MPEGQEEGEEEVQSKVEAPICTTEMCEVVQIEAG